MEQYIVSARKYRPAHFSSVVGQQSLTATLKNAIASDRLAHAYIFCGGRGVGKTSCARIFAKTINCTNRDANGEPCEQCDSCRQFNQGRSLNILELDAASHNGIEDIKGIIEQTMVPPTTGKYRVFIIDEVHMLSPAAFNAFLKTLEEPPAHAIFILATTEKHKILPTILSRCQIYDFNRISIPDMVAHMQNVARQEGIEAEPEALAVIARKADGAMRDALSIFDQLAAFTQGKITYKATIENLNELDRAIYGRLISAMVAQDIPGALLIYKEVRDRGFDSQFFINGLAQYLRDLMVAATPSTCALIEAPDSERQALAEQAATLHPTFLYKAMELCNDADFNYRAATNKQFLVELTLIRLCQLLSPSSINEGDDGGQLQPLHAVTPSVTPAPQAPSPSPAPAVHVDSRAINLSPMPESRLHASPSVAGSPLRVGGISLRYEKAAPAAAKPEERRREKSSTDAETIAAWKGLAAGLAAEPLIRSVIDCAVPAVVAPMQLRLTVPSAMQSEILTANKERLTGLLRDALDNDSADYTVEINDADLDPAYWPEKRVLDHMLKEHPVLADYVAKFKLLVI